MTAIGQISEGLLLVSVDKDDRQPVSSHLSEAGGPVPHHLGNNILLCFFADPVTYKEHAHRIRDLSADLPVFIPFVFFHIFSQHYMKLILNIAVSCSVFHEFLIT